MLVCDCIFANVCPHLVRQTDYDRTMNIERSSKVTLIARLMLEPSLKTVKLFVLSLHFLRELELEFFQFRPELIVQINPFELKNGPINVDLNVEQPSVDNASVDVIRGTLDQLNAESIEIKDATYMELPNISFDKEKTTYVDEMKEVIEEEKHEMPKETMEQLVKETGRSEEEILQEHPEVEIKDRSFLETVADGIVDFVEKIGEDVLDEAKDTILPEEITKVIKKDEEEDDVLDYKPTFKDTI